MKKMLSLVLALALALTVCSVSLADTEGADLTGKKVGFSALMMSSEFFTDMTPTAIHRPRSRPSKTSCRWAWITSSASWWTGCPSPTR